MSGLAATITRTTPPADGISLWRLGQAGFLVRTPEVTIGIDLYLSDWLERVSDDNPEPVTRATPSPLRPEDLPRLDVAFATHEHPDHLDPGTIAAIARRHPTTRVVVPEPLRQHAVALGVGEGQVVGALRDRVFDLPGLVVRPVAAAHAFHPEAFGGYTFWLDEHGHDRALGYVLELNGVRLFHAGDTVYWPGMAEHLRDLHIDIGLLPINGRDWARERAGLVGNLSVDDAAALAWHADMDLVVPCHYDGIVGNTADPGAFATALSRTYPQQAFRVLEQGEELRYTP